MGMGVVDTMMVGHYGAMELASVAAANNYCFGVLIIALGILMGLDPLTSQAWGAGRVSECGHLMVRGLWLALLLAIPTALAWALTEPVLRWADQPAEILSDAGCYARWLIPGALPILLFQSLRQTLQGIGAVRPVMWVCLAANLFNALADWVLIYGRLGAPALGVSGAGIATSLSRWFLFGGLAWLGLRRGRAAGIWPAAGRASATLTDVCRIGLPVGLQYGLEVGMFSLVGILMGWIGALPLAGHQIALNLASLSFMVPMGLSVAASVRVGHAIGAGDAVGARRACWVALGCGFGVMSVSATLFWTLPGQLASLYSGEAELVLIAAQLLPLAALFQLFDGTQAVGFGVLRGTGDTRVPMLINVLGYYGLALPLGWWLTFRYWEGDPRGPWVALIVGLGVVALMIVLRLWCRLRRPLLPLDS